MSEQEANKPVTDAQSLHVQSAGGTPHFFGVCQEEGEGTLLTLVNLLAAATIQGVSVPALRLPDQLATTGEQIIEEYLWYLAQSVDGKVRQTVARNPQTPVEVLQTLSLDHDEKVRASVAGNSQTPVEILQTLTHDHDEKVRVTVAWHPQTPAEVLQTLAQDHAGRIRAGVAEHPQTAVEVLRTLALDRDMGVRRAVIWHTRTPMETLQTLAQDHDGPVQHPASLIIRLFVAVEELVREEKWRKQLTMLLRDPYGLHLTMAYAHHLTRDTSIEKQLDGVIKLDVPESIRQVVIDILATDWDTSMVQAAFSENTRWKHILVPFIPPIALQKLAGSPSWEVRYLVALHPQTPWEIRQHLSQDGNRYVRAMARAKAAQMAEEGTA